MVKEYVRQFPLPLLELKDAKLLTYANSFLKYDTGIEIECDFKYEPNLSYNQKVVVQRKAIDKFKAIPGIKSVNCDSYEQRFRIPYGIDGLICLWNICNTLKEFNSLNPLSGIHYHIDFTDVFQYIQTEDLESNEKWILKSLKSWKYDGSYNSWKVAFQRSVTTSTAVRVQSDFNTVEFRIGEMSFEYELLVKRIIHCQNISKLFKDKILEAHKVKESKEQLQRKRRISNIYRDTVSQAY